MAHVKDILLERILTGPETCGLNPLHVGDTWTLGNVWVRVKIAGKLSEQSLKYSLAILPARWKRCDQQYHRYIPSTAFNKAWLSRGDERR